MKHSNKDGTLSAESAEGRLRLKENTFPLDTYPTQRGTARVPRVGEGADKLCLAAIYPREEPDALKKRSETQRARKRAIKNWNPSDLPSWLTRDAYVTKVQPALATIAKSRIRSALGVSEPYSSYIQTGKVIPHPRHWQALAKLVGV